MLAGARVEECRLIARGRGAICESGDPGNSSISIAWRMLPVRSATIARVAAVVDPQRDVVAITAFAAERADLQSSTWFLTHFHADFLARGFHLEARAIALRERPLYAGRSGEEAEYAFTPLHDGNGH